MSARAQVQTRAVAVGLAPSGQDDPTHPLNLDWLQRPHLVVDGHLFLLEQREYQLATSGRTGDRALAPSRLVSCLCRQLPWKRAGYAERVSVQADGLQSDGAAYRPKIEYLVSR